MADVGYEDRSERIRIGVSVVGEDARGSLDERCVQRRAVGICNRHRCLVVLWRCCMDRTGARIGERAARDWQELPVIGCRVKGQLQDAIGGRVAQLTAWPYGAEAVMARASG